MKRLLVVSVLVLSACPTVKPLDCTRDRDCYRDEFCNRATLKCEPLPDAGDAHDSGVPDSGTPDAGSTSSVWDEDSWDEKNWVE